MKSFLQYLKEDKLNELKMDHKTYVGAMKRATDYEADYAGDSNRIDTDKLLARAKKNKGEKFAKDLAGADQMTERPNRNKVSGQWGSDQLAWRKPSRETKDGKANKTDLKSLKGSLTKGDYRKPRFKKRNLPEEALDEASVTPASKKAEKGTKWKVKSRNPDREGSEVELRQGKRVKMRGAFDLNANDFNMSPTKKGKIDWKAKSQYFDSPKDILKTVKEEALNEKLKGIKDPKKREEYIRNAKLDKDQAIDDREHYKKNLTDPDRAWTKGIPHKDSQYKMAVDRNKRAMKRKKYIDKAENLQELRKPKNDAKMKKFIPAANKAAEKDAFNTYYNKYDSEKDARKAVQREKTPEARDKAASAKVERLKAAARAMRFQKMNSKKK